MKPSILLWATYSLALVSDPSAAFTPSHLSLLKLRALTLFSHGWNSYINYGFPADEVRPLTCTPYGPDYDNPENQRNDAMGNVSLTLLDNLDSLIIMKQWTQLQWALLYLQENQQTLFEQDTVVQVFEALIRWLGGLLLAHLILTDVEWSHDPEMAKIARNYDGFLLRMAHDLGKRLIPAYKTSTQLPYPRINLKLGLAAVPAKLNKETCTLGATTPVVEFSLLLKLTGDSQFELHTTNTFWKLWLLRLLLGFMPMSIDPVLNKWLDEITGIGALVDSFYEYALKGAILFNDNALWSVFARSYLSLLTHLAQSFGVDGYTYFANVDITSGTVATTWIDSLGAFWAGVQVLAGRLSDAVSSHLIYLKIWDYYDSIPERWETQSGTTPYHSHQERLDSSVSLEWYPLRPEFIESTYYLYRATRDPLYLQIGSRILDLFETRYKAPCGFAGIQDIRSGKLQNRMETFVLGELLKYLYLLFDESNESFVHSKQMKSKNWVFSTEAHPLWYSPKLGAKSSAKFQKAMRKLKFTASTASVNDNGNFDNFDSSLSGLGRPKTIINGIVEDPECPGPASFPFGPDLVPTLSDLDTCEVAPRQYPKEKPKFVSSAYFSWSKVFSPDDHFSTTLVRPQHFRKHDKNSLDNYIEISQSFFNTYGMASGTLKCPRRPTTFEQEYIFGKPTRPEEVEMFRVQNHNLSLPFLQDDLVMPMITGRLRMELLKPGTIDSTNIRISRDYIRRMHPEKYVSKSAEVLRLNRINGLPIGKNRTVWTDRAFLEQNSATFLVAKNDNVYLQGKYVENLRAYTFPSGEPLQNIDIDLSDSSLQDH